MMMTVLLCASLVWALILACLDPSAGPAAAAKQTERSERMDKSKEKEKLMDLIVDAKRADPETGSFTEWLAGFLLDHGVTVPADDVPEALKENRRPAPAFRVGDRAWQTNGTDVFELKVKRLLYDCGHVAFDESAVGQTIFKTSTEAEAALAKMRAEGCE